MGLCRDPYVDICRIEEKSMFFNCIFVSRCEYRGATSAGVREETKILIGKLPDASAKKTWRWCAWRRGRDVRGQITKDKESNIPDTD